MEETYDLHTYLPEMREAMEMWETLLKDLVAESAVRRLAA